jgi:hypothetical protein
MDKHRNITKTPSGWYVAITRRADRYAKYFKELTDAIAWRDEMEAAHPIVQPVRVELTRAERNKIALDKVREKNAKLIAAGLCIQCERVNKSTRKSCEDCRRIDRINKRR